MLDVDGKSGKVAKVAKSWLMEDIVVLNCKNGQIPFVYFGLPIGVNHRHLSFLYPLIDSIRKRLSSWKSKNLSMDYFLSFFRAPSGIISLIESLFNSFLWGGEEAR